MLTVPDIEEAERICLKWDQRIVNEAKKQRLKVHLHPYSYRRRPADKLSLHPMFKSRYDPLSIPVKKESSLELSRDKLANGKSDRVKQEVQSPDMSLQNKQNHALTSIADLGKSQKDIPASASLVKEEKTSNKTVDNIDAKVAEVKTILKAT